MLNVLFIAIMAAIGYAYELNYLFWLGLSVAIALLIRQLYVIRNRERDACFWAFLNNNYVGLAIFAGVVFGFMPL